MEQKRITSIIFDCDGVLLDTEPIYTEAANAVLRPYSKSLPLQLKLALLGQSGGNVGKIMVRELQLPMTPEEYAERAKKEEQKRFPFCKLKSGAEEAVALAKGIPKAIATTSITSSFEIKAKDKGHFFSQFPIIIKGDEVREPKPAPDIFLKAFAELEKMYPGRIEREKCLVIEDSPAGVRGALKAGMQVAWLLDPIYEPEWYDQFNDLLHVPRFTSLLDIIKRFI